MIKKYFKHIAVCGFSVFTLTSAGAAVGGLFVEPMLTYEKGDATVNFPAPFGNSDSTVNGFGVGVRGGIHIIDTVFVGADLRYSMPTYRNSKTGISTDATAFNYGIVAGIHLPIVGLRAWAGYILGGGLDPDKSQGIDLNFVNADGFRIGAGYQLAMVSLNLEYQHMNYGTTEVQNAGIFTGPTNSIVQDNDSIIFGISFPVAL
jgi:hypothetical protein